MNAHNNNARKHTEAAALQARVEALLPGIRARAAEARSLRKVPETTITELQDAGFFLALQPAAYSGYELDPQDFFHMQLAIAGACMSTAWAAGIVAVHAFQLALMDRQAQEDVWGEDIHTRVSSSYAPLGKVTPCEGGFRLSGRWGWSSGSDHCTWALLGAIVPGEGYRTFLVPRSDYRIEDTWRSMGLQGTGSNDIIVADAFVPDYRTHKQLDGFTGNNPGVQADGPALYRLPWAQTFIRVVSTPAIGAARDALALYRELVLSKASGDITKLVGDPSVAERMAAADNTLDEMEAVLFRNFDTMMATLRRGESIAIADRARYRYQASLVIEKSMAVVDSLFASAGGSSVFAGSEIQQRFLDIHTARAHVANNPTGFARNFGGLLLGADNQDLFI